MIIDSRQNVTTPALLGGPNNRWHPLGARGNQKHHSINRLRVLIALCWFHYLCYHHRSSLMAIKHTFSIGSFSHWIKLGEMQRSECDASDQLTFSSENFPFSLCCCCCCCCWVHFRPSAIGSFYPPGPFALDPIG